MSGDGFCGGGRLEDCGGGRRSLVVADAGELGGGHPGGEGLWELRDDHVVAAAGFVSLKSAE